MQEHFYTTLGVQLIFQSALVSGSHAVFADYGVEFFHACVAFGHSLVGRGAGLAFEGLHEREASDFQRAVEFAEAAVLFVG